MVYFFYFRKVYARDAKSDAVASISISAGVLGGTSDVSGSRSGSGGGIADDRESQFEAGKGITDALLMSASPSTKMLGSTGSSAGSYGTAGAGSSSGSSSGKTVVG